MTTTIVLSPAIKTALIQSVSMSIDMLNDMALDPMFLTPSDLRKLAETSDEEIRKTFRKNADEAFKNVDQLLALQMLYSELTVE